MARLPPPHRQTAPMRKLILASALLVSLAPAQTAAPPAGELPAARDRDALPGLAPGTRRYNVTFAARPFDLLGFRAAIATGADATAMARIVADLQARAVAHQAPFAQALAALGGRVDLQFWLINACTIEIRPEQLAAVRALPNVAFVDPDLPTEVLIATSTNANNHNADAVQATGLRAEGFGVAIVDTGQDDNMAGTGRPHQIYYRDGNVADTTGGGLGGSRLLANVALASLPADNAHPHGIGVAGIAGGEVWSNVAGDRGHASDARLVGYSICDVAGSCTSTLSIEAAGWQQCAADKVKYNIVAANMSYGSSPSLTDVSQQAIDAAALNADIVAVCAAGNSSGSTTGSAAVSNGLAVAAVAPNTKTMASFSSRGPLSGDTQRFYPDIAGCGVSTVMPLHESETSNYTASGTSMASPQVCGAAALVKAARPGSSAREIKAILLASTENIAAQNPGYDRNAYGLGFLRDDLAVALAQQPGSVVSGSLAAVATPQTHTILVASGQQYAVCLVFFRHLLASTGFSNLSLRVLNGAAVVASSDDPRNLYEKVTFTAPVSGVLTVEVDSSSLEIPNLPYSLATTAMFLDAAPSRWVLAGKGCPGASGIPSLFPTGQPLVGGSLTTRLAYATGNSLCLFLLGFSNSSWNGVPLPADLSAQGAPGCFLRVSADGVNAGTTDAFGTAAIAYGIPANPALLSLTLEQQALSFDATANALEFAFSNAGTLTVGGL